MGKLRVIFSYCCLLFCLFPCRILLAENDSKQELKFWDFEPPATPQVEAALLEFATSELESDSERKGLVFLVELQERKSRTQWIVEFEPGTDESESPEPSDIEDVHTVIHASSGDYIEFSSKFRTIHLRSIGGYRVKEGKPEGKWEKKRVQSVQVKVPQDFLMLGFDRLAELTFKFKDDDSDRAPFSISAGPNPFPLEQVQATRVAMIERGITSEHIAPVLGMGPALNSFFELIRSTPGISDILMEIVDRPSLFSIISKGINLFFQNHGRYVVVADSEQWQLEADKVCYKIPITLLVNQKPALHFFLVVTAPEPPYDLTGGVVGLEVYSPKDPDKLLVATLLPF